MAGEYTLKNFEQVKDVGAELGAAGFEARFAGEDLDAERTGVGHVRLAPGTRQPIGHHHEEAEEVYVVIAGSGRVKLDDEIVEIERLDAIRVAPPVIRSFEAGPEGLEYIACGARHDNDGAAIPGWWSD